MQLDTDVDVQRMSQATEMIATLTQRMRAFEVVLIEHKKDLRQHANEIGAGAQTLYGQKAVLRCDYEWLIHQADNAQVLLVRLEKLEAKQVEKP